MVLPETTEPEIQKDNALLRLLLTRFNCITATPEVPGNWVELTGADAKEMATGGWTGVKVGVKLGVKVGVKVFVKVGVKVGVKLGVKVGVNVGVKVFVKEGVSVGVKVGVKVGARILWLWPAAPPVTTAVRPLTTPTATTPVFAIESAKASPPGEFKLKTTSRLTGVPGTTVKKPVKSWNVTDPLAVLKVWLDTNAESPASSIPFPFTSRYSRTLPPVISLSESIVPDAVKTSFSTFRPSNPDADNCTCTPVTSAWLNR